MTAVLQEVVLGQGVCGGPGLVVVYSAAVRPEFPETAEQARHRRRAEQRIASGEEIEDFDPVYETPRGNDLILAGGRKVEREAVDGAFERQACALGPLAVPEGWDLAALEPEDQSRLFGSGIPRGWKRMRRRFPDMECLVRLSAPGYSGERDHAVVSYSRMAGASSGMGGFVALSYSDGRWQIEWHESLWVS